MTDNTNNDPHGAPDQGDDNVDTSWAATEADDTTPNDVTADSTATDLPGDPDAAGDSGGDDDLGAGAFDVPTTQETTDAGATAGATEAGDAESGATSADDSEAGSGDGKPKKAYLGRPELAPLYAMAGLADLAASVVRDIANEQIAAYRARRTKADGAAGSEDAAGADEATTQETADAQFNEFLTKAQQRTQELFDQALAQYEHLADRGRVAVGEAFESARQQQKSRAPEDIVRMKPEDVSAAAQKAADKIATAVQTAADRVSRAADESTTSTDPTAGTDTTAGSDTTDGADTGPAGPGGAAGDVDTDQEPGSPQV